VGIVLGLFVRSNARAWVLHAALALLLAGAGSNLYDRGAIGSVRDMLWLFPGVRLPFGWRWPGGSDELYPWIFNVADAAMCVALVLLLVLVYRSDRKRPLPADAPTD
jgi:lipoprotein signal peptidase